MAHITGVSVCGLYVSARSGRTGTSPLVLKESGGRNYLPRKPNYKFERFERDRAKAAKKAARLQAAADRRSTKKGEDGEIEGAANEAVAVSEDSADAGPKTE